MKSTKERSGRVKLIGEEWKEGAQEASQREAGQRKTRTEEMETSRKIRRKKGEKERKK